MALKFVILALLVYCASEAQSQGDDTSLPLSYDVTEIQGDGATCPLDQLRQETQENITSDIRTQLQDSAFPSVLVQQGYTRIAYLDMTDPNQQCPPNWQEIIASGVRACARPTGTTTGSFHSAFYPSNGTSYSRVCGRVTGYQFCSTSAFGFFLNDDIEHLYVDGLTITHGSPKQHVWTFAAAFIEEDTTWTGCPCIDTPNDANPQIPSFIGDDYFCDTGSDVDRLPPCGDISTNLLTDHPLWDGGGCGPTGACCENNNPPWFCTTLPQPTTDDIEVRLTCNEAVDDEDVAIELVEIYIN